MKTATTKRLLAIACGVFTLTIFGGWLGGRISQAQAQTSAVLQLTGNWSAHTACTPTPAQTTLCIASDGLWISLNGAAFTQLGATAPAGVTSFNGQTGVVVYTPPVVSVNGKTGAIIVTASTTATTTLN